MEAEILESFFAVMGRFPLGVNSFEKSENYRIENDTGSGTAAEYGVPGLTACPMMTEGQVFTTLR